MKKYEKLMRTLEDDHRRKMLFFKYNFRPHASACVLEPIFHTGGVASSILAAPTISARRYRIDPRRKSGSAVLAQRFA
jgi:hypothetical protein